MIQALCAFLLGWILRGLCEATRLYDRCLVCGQLQGECCHTEKRSDPEDRAPYALVTGTASEPSLGLTRPSGPANRVVKLGSPPPRESST